VERWTKEEMEATHRRMARNLCEQIEGDTGACPGCERLRTAILDLTDLRFCPKCDAVTAPDYGDDDSPYFCDGCGEAWEPTP
jgi:hypothetical protein